MHQHLYHKYSIAVALALICCCCAAAEARGVVRSVLDLLQSQLPIYDPSTDDRTPLSLQQLDDRRSRSGSVSPVPSYAATAAQHFTFRRDKAFANYKASRTLYVVAAQDFTTSMACLKRLQAQLSAPAAAAAGGGGRSSGHGGASAGAAGGSGATPLALTGLALELTDAVDALQAELQQLDDEAASAQQVQQLGGTEQQWQQLVAAANSRLDPQHMVAWFAALKQQRVVFLAAVRDLQNTPATGERIMLGISRRPGSDAQMLDTST